MYYSKQMHSTCQNYRQRIQMLWALKPMVSRSAEFPFVRTASHSLSHIAELDSKLPPLAVRISLFVSSIDVDVRSEQDISSADRF